MATGDNGAGSSARREYERRSAKDEARLRADWGPFGGLAVALSSERQSTKSWSIGAIGERRVGALLDGIRSVDVRVLHDRRIPNSRANIDHLVVTSGGVWVVDTKMYKGRPELRVEGGLFRPRLEKLFVAGRDKTALVDGVHGQLESVRRALGDIPIRGALCFVDADWPLFAGPFTVEDVDVLWPKKLLSHIAATRVGPLDVAAVERQLVARFRGA